MTLPTTPEGWIEYLNNKNGELTMRVSSLETKLEEVVTTLSERADEHQDDYNTLLRKIETSKEALGSELIDAERRLDSAISDERFDRERADNDLESKIDNLQHRVDYG